MVWNTIISIVPLSIGIVGLAESLKDKLDDLNRN
jgi:hypothetical protein